MAQKFLIGILAANAPSGAGTRIGLRSPARIVPGNVGTDFCKNVLLRLQLIIDGHTIPIWFEFVISRLF